MSSEPQPHSPVQHNCRTLLDEQLFGLSELKLPTISNSRGLKGWSSSRVEQAGGAWRSQATTAQGREPSLQPDWRPGFSAGSGSGWGPLWTGGGLLIPEKWLAGAPDSSSRSDAFWRQEGRAEDLLLLPRGAAQVLLALNGSAATDQLTRSKVNFSNNS